MLRFCYRITSSYNFSADQSMETASKVAIAIAFVTIDRVVLHASRQKKRCFRDAQAAKKGIVKLYWIVSLNRLRLPLRGAPFVNLRLSKG